MATRAVKTSRSGQGTEMDGEITITIGDIQEMLNLNPMAKLQVEGIAKSRMIAGLEAKLAALNGVGEVTEAEGVEA